MGGNLRILEEQPSPFAKYERCMSQVPYWRLNNLHYNSDKYRIVEERWRRRETLQHCFEASRVVTSVKSDTMDPIMMASKNLHPSRSRSKGQKGGRRRGRCRRQPPWRQHNWRVMTAAPAAIVGYSCRVRPCGASAVG